MARFIYFIYFNTYIRTRIFRDKNKILISWFRSPRIAIHFIHFLSHDS